MPLGAASFLCSPNLRAVLHAQKSGESSCTTALKMLHLNLKLTRERHKPDILCQPFHVVAPLGTSSRARSWDSTTFCSRCVSQQPWTRPRLLPSSMLTTGPSERIALVLLRSRLQVLAFLEILDQSHVTHCSVQLPILDPGLLLKGDDIVQDSSLCCFGSWVRRSLDVAASALDQESLLGAACPRVGWRAVSSMCDGLTSGSHWDLTPASQSAASSSSKPQSCQGSSFTGAPADGAATPSLSPAP